MCGIGKCCVCGLLKEKCGQACHSEICQLYLSLYVKKHHTDGRKSDFDGELYRQVSGTW